MVVVIIIFVIIIVVIIINIFIIIISRADTLMQMCHVCERVCVARRALK